MMLLTFILYLSFTVAASENRFSRVSSVDEYLNLCINSRSHKKSPSEETIVGKCKAWTGKTCCTAATVDKTHSKKLYKFDYNHCNKNMSKACRDQLFQEWCFFECSPYMGPWMVKVQGWKTRKERSYKLPLCRFECDKWWNACKDDYTCVRVWSNEFKWSKKGNSCPKHKKCRPFSEVYKNSVDFCESIWDNGWKVAPESSKDCFVYELTAGKPNPNRAVAHKKAVEILEAVNSATQSQVVQLWKVLSLVMVSTVFGLWMMTRMDRC